MCKVLICFVVFTYAVIIPAHASLCPSDIRKFENLLCQAVEYTLPGYIPGGNVAHHFIDKYFSSVNAPSWKANKESVEKLINEKIDQTNLRRVTTWHDSMVSRIATCNVKQNKELKSDCYQNLQEDLSGFEPHFRGRTKKEKALFLKYYQVYVVTYLSISKLFKDLCEEDYVKKSIDADISTKAKIFKEYLERAIVDTRVYRCRHVKINIERELLFWWRNVEYWPKSVEGINGNDLVRKVNPKPSTLKTIEIVKRPNYANDFESVGYRGCGVMKQSRMFHATIYNIKSEKMLGNFTWRFSACSNAEGIASCRINALQAWRYEMMLCTSTSGRLDLDEVIALLELLKKL